MAILLPALLLVLPVAARAVPSRAAALSVQELVRLGNQALLAAEYVGAYNWFKVALERRAQDAEALAGLGTAAVHLQQFDEGIELLARARQAGATSRMLDLDEATARYGLKQYGAALTSLDRFDRLPPVPEGVFLRAVIHFEERRDRDARALFGSLTGHPRLAPKARLYLASLDAREGKLAEARRAAAALQESAPRTPVGVLAGRLLEGLARPSAAPGARWTFDSAVRAGYDTNVLGIGDGQLLPPSLSRQGAGLLNLHTGAAVSRKHRDGDVLFGRFYADAYFYDGFSDFNHELIALGGGWERSLPGGRVFSLTGSVLEVLLGETHFASTFQLSPSYTFHSRETLNVRVYGVATAQDFQSTPDPANLNRNGSQLDLGVTAVHTPRGSRWQLSGLLQRGFVDTRGRDFDADVTNALITTRRNLSERSDAQLVAGWTAHDYRNVNSRAATPIARDDDLYLTGLTYRHLIGARGPTASLSLTWYDNHSNIDLFRYQRNVSTLGVTWRY